MKYNVMYLFCGIKFITTRPTPVTYPTLFYYLNYQPWIEPGVSYAILRKGAWPSVISNMNRS